MRTQTAEIKRRIHTPQPADIVEALRACGCGIVRYKLVYSKDYARPDAEPAAPVETPEPPEGFPITLKRILQAVSCETKVGMNELLSPRRHARIVRARHIYFSLARKLTAKSLPSIGNECGRMDHTTVLHGCAKVEGNPGAYEPELSKVLGKLRRTL